MGIDQKSLKSYLRTNTTNSEIITNYQFEKLRSQQKTSNVNGSKLTKLLKMNQLISLALAFIAVCKTAALPGAIPSDSNLGLRDVVITDVSQLCPSSCRCESGASWDGGQNVDASGFCSAYCSKWGYCGSGEKYTKEGSTYCGFCAYSNVVLKKEGEICGSGFWDPTQWEDACAPGLVCKVPSGISDAAPKCIRGIHGKRSALKKEGEICGSGFWSPTKWEGDCARGLVCKGQVYNPDAPPTCIRDGKHTCCNEPYPTYWYEGGFCCNDGKWHPNASDGTGNCYNLGLQPSAPC